MSLGEVIAQGAVGLLVGYALTRALKLVLTVVGLFLLLLAALEARGLITVNWQLVQELFSQLLRDLQAQDWGSLAARIGPLSLGAVVGAILARK